MMFEKEILDIIRNDNIHNYVSRNYYNMSKEQLKNLFMEAICAIYNIADKTEYADFLEEFADGVEYLVTED